MNKFTTLWRVKTEDNNSIKLMEMQWNENFDGQVLRTGTTCATWSQSKKEAFEYFIEISSWHVSRNNATMQDLAVESLSLKNQIEEVKQMFKEIDNEQ